MVVLSKNSTDVVHKLLTDTGIIIEQDRTRDLIAGIRLRLQDIARDLATDEEISAAIRGQCRYHEGVL